GAPGRGAAPPQTDGRGVEEEVLRVPGRGSDDLADLLTVGHGEEEGARLARRYDGAFPEAYKEDFGAGTAVDDLKRMETLPEDDGLGFHVYTPPSDDGADRRLKGYRTGAALPLAPPWPIFSQIGIEVLDERPYEITRPDGTASYIYDFGLRLPTGTRLDPDRAADVVDTLRLLWRGEIEQDGFNSLVLRAG